MPARLNDDVTLEAVRERDRSGLVASLFGIHA
jgi:hypothetical protein